MCRLDFLHKFLQPRRDDDDIRQNSIRKFIILHNLSPILLNYKMLAQLHACSIDTSRDGNIMELGFGLGFVCKKGKDEEEEVGLGGNSSPGQTGGR